MDTFENNINKKTFPNRLKETIWNIKYEYPLHHHTVFWLPIAICLSLAFYSGYNALDLSWSFPSTTDDIEEVVARLKLPLLFLSLAVPISVAIGRFHGSAQRAVAIRIAFSNQSFEHYFKHVEYFIEHMKLCKYMKSTSTNFQLTDPRALYKMIYPNSTMDNFNILPTYEVNRDIKANLTKVPNLFASFDFINYSTVESKLNIIGSPFGVSLKSEKHNMTLPPEVRPDYTHVCYDLMEAIEEVVEHALSFNRDKQSYVSTFEDTRSQIVKNMNSSEVRTYLKKFDAAFMEMASKSKDMGYS